MKIFTLMMALTAVSSFGSRAMAADGDQHEKVVAISDAYVPSGFDSTSDTFVVVNGWFANSCYKMEKVDVSHVGPFLHELTTKAMVTEGLCLAVIIPFHKEVQLGKLQAGDHTIHFMNGEGTYLEKHLTVGN